MIGEKIRFLRKSQNITLQTLSAKLGIDAGTLSRIERGKSGVSEALIHKISLALKLSPAQLFTSAAATYVAEHGSAYVGSAHDSHTLTPYSPQTRDFVHWFRSVAPYIHDFGGRTFVIAFGGEVVSEQQFVALSHDLNLLASLEVRLVLVHGARPQIEQRLARARIVPRYSNGLRVTDDAAMEAVKEANGAIRVEIEALLSMALVNSPMAGANIRVASGNFVTAKPLGVRDGIDLQHTGEVRKIDAAGIRKRLDVGDLVLLSPMGYSATGDTFNLTLEDVAVSVAIALDADKLIFLMDSDGVHNARGELLREMTADKAKNLLRNVENTEAPRYFSEDAEFYLPAAVRACEQGVDKTHLISRNVDGAIIQELFTHDGIGTMITELPLETLRPADIEDINAILQIIEPLEDEGILVRRGRERIEMEIHDFYLMEHDGRVIGCAALRPYGENAMAELACLAIQPDYRGHGRGERLFHFCEAQALSLGYQAIFCLTTRTEHWFIERGFHEADIGALPVSRRATYNPQRNSKIFVKNLSK